MQHINDYDFSTEETDIIQAIHDGLNTEFEAEFDNDANPNFDGFELFGRYLQYQVPLTIKVAEPGGSCQLTFTDVFYGRGGQPTSNHVSSDRQNWLIADLHRDFGHVIIRHPTMLGRFMNLLTHTELKFPDDKQFTKHFQVVATDHDKASLAITQSFRDTLYSYAPDDMFIEIIGKKLIAGNFKTFNVDDAFRMVVLGSKLAALR